MNLMTTTSKVGFPSHLLDPSVKRNKKWCLTYIKAFHDEHKQGLGSPMFRNMAEQYKEWRDIARGKQSVDRYKPQLGIRKGREKKSYKSLDFAILPIAPKFVKLLMGKIMNKDIKVHVATIDKFAKTEKQEYKNKLRVHMALKEQNEAMAKKTGMRAPSPVPEGAPMPESVEEIDIHTDMFFKDELAMEFHDVLKKTHDFSNMKQIEYEYVRDLVEVGVGGTRTYIDGHGMIKIRRTIPERMITNNVKYDDFRDMVRVGEYIEMTISELKDLAGNQFTEAEYQKMAEQASNKSYGDRAFVNSYYEQHQYYPYDSEKIVVLDAEWFSSDKYIYQVKPNRFGNRNIYKKDLDWMKNTTPEEYNKNHDDRKVIVEEVQNVYNGMWVVDTDFIFNYGLKTDMPRAAHNLTDTMLGYSLYTTAFDSIMRMIEPVVHQSQINWLQYQNHIGKSRPSGLEIEMSALENITLGKGKIRMSPKEALSLYMDTGILVWRRKQWNGASNQWRPINELKNGVSEAAAQHLQFIVQQIDLLRNILGLNEVVDSSTPNPEIGKAVGEMVSEGTNNALYYLFNAHKSVYMNTAKQVALQVPAMIDKAKKNKGLVSLFGEETIRFFSGNNDLNLREMGIEIMEGADNEKKARISMYVQRSIDKQELLPEDAILIEEEDNLYRAAQLLRMKRREREKANRDSQMQMYEAESQKNIESANASAQAEIMKLQEEHKLKLEYEEFAHQLKVMEEREKTSNQLLILKYQSGEKLTELEMQRITDLQKANVVGEWNYSIAKLRGSQSGQRQTKQPARKQLKAS